MFLLDPAAREGLSHAESPISEVVQSLPLHAAVVGAAGTPDRRDPAPAGDVPAVAGRARLRRCGSDQSGTVRAYPVTPIGEVPTATHPTDLARPPAALRTTLAQQVFRYRDEPRRVQRISIDRVVAAPGRTSLEWTITSVTDQSTFVLEPALSPIGGILPDDVDVLDPDVVSGPMIRPEGLPAAKPSKVSWMTTAVAGRKAYECLCSPWDYGRAHCDAKAARPA